MKRSTVVFDEAAHTYTDGDVVLSGITSLIHEVLGLGVYPDASDYVAKVQIPKAGYYGSCVHLAINVFDTFGIEMTSFPKKEHPTAGTLPAQDVSVELMSYRMNKPAGFRTLASEFTVSYGSFASQIDSVWCNEQDDIYLVDYKTNNLDYYPGGADGLMEYLSWQLSCYAVMFERQTSRKVKGLIGFWLRKGEVSLWRISRQPDDKVLCLLGTEVVPSPSGGFTYRNELMQVAVPVPEFPAGGALVVPAEVTKAIADMLRAERAAKEMKERLRTLMEAAGVTKWECGDFTATIGKESVTKTFDSKRFKDDNPELYAKYVKEVGKKGSFIIKEK